MTEWISGTVDRVQFWTDSLFSLYLHAPIAPFQAGQFAKLGLQLEGEKIQRAYSYVNAPSNPLLEFYLVTVPEGRLSPALSQLTRGDSVLISQNATGFFVLDEIPACDTLWMLATGTAIGPYLSILQEKSGLERFRRIVLVHAARYACDLSYLPMMQALEQSYNGKLKIHTIVSREKVPGMSHGRIPQLIAEGVLEAALDEKISAEASHVMLCGNPQMVRDTQKILKEQRAMTKHLRRKPGQITSEHYW